MKCRSTVIRGVYMCVVPWSCRILTDPRVTYLPSTKMTGQLHTLTMAAIFFTLSQTGLVYSQECGRELQGSCCQVTTASCPSRYYRDDLCPTPQPTTSTTTVMEDPEDSNSTESVITDSFNTTDSSFTEGNVTDDASTTSTPSTTSSTTTRGTLLSCRHCSSNCLNCNTTVCLNCDEGFELEDGGCKEDKEELPIVAIVAGAAGGGVLIIVIIIVVIYCCCRNRGSGTPNMDTVLEDRNRLNNKDDYSEVDSEAGSPEVSSQRVAHPTYINTAFVHDNMSRQIEQGQDRVLRYTRDPTFKKQDYVDEPVYGNRAIIDSTILSELGEAPAPPGSAKKHKAKSPDPIEEGEEEEIYVNKNVQIVPDIGYSEEVNGDDMEVYYNEGAGQEEEEDDGEEVYVNFKP